MRRFTFDICDLSVELCEEIEQAFNEGEELLLAIEDYDSSKVKLDSYGILLKKSYKECMLSYYKYEESKYKKIIGIDEDNRRTIEMSLHLYGHIEVAEIDCEQDLGDITLYVKIQKRRDPVVYV